MCTYTFTSDDMILLISFHLRNIKHTYALIHLLLLPPLQSYSNIYTYNIIILIPPSMSQDFYKDTRNIITFPIQNISK